MVSGVWGGLCADRTRPLVSSIHHTAPHFAFSHLCDLLCFLLSLCHSAISCTTFWGFWLACLLVLESILQLPWTQCFSSTLPLPLVRTILIWTAGFEAHSCSGSGPVQVFKHPPPLFHWLCSDGHAVHESSCKWLLHPECWLWPLFKDLIQHPKSFFPSVCLREFPINTAQQIQANLTRDFTFHGDPTGSAKNDFEILPHRDRSTVQHKAQC